MSARPPALELERPRDFSQLVNTAMALYRAHFRLLVAIGAAIVVPVDLIVLGVGLEQLWAGYDATPGLAQTAIPPAVSLLVTTPLIAAATISALLELDAGRAPSAGASIQRGLEAFAAVLAALLLAAAGIAVGLVLLLLPGLYLAVRWYFVAQAVVVDGARGVAALRRSSELVAGSWWRVFGIGVGVALIVFVPAGLIVIPFELGAEAADRMAIALAGQLLADALTAPLGTLLVTLLYFDLRARRRGALVPG